MAFLHRLLAYAARKVAADPRVQRKAAEFVETELKPRARELGRDARTKLGVVKDELKDIARETDPRDNPRAFAAKVKDRIKELKDAD